MTRLMIRPPTRPPTRPPSRPADRRDAGSIALEVVIAAPVLLLMLALVFGYGRVSTVNGRMQSGVRDAARSASQARSVDEAQLVAERVVRDALGAGATDCQASLRVDPIPVFQPGLPVEVHAACRYPLSDLGLPGLIGDVTAQATFLSVLDPNRGIRP